MLSVKQGDIKYYFWVFGMTRHGIEPTSVFQVIGEHSTQLTNFVEWGPYLSNFKTTSIGLFDFCFRFPVEIPI